MTVFNRSRQSEWLRINVVFWLTMMLFNAGFVVADKIAWWLSPPGGGLNLVIVFVIAYVLLGYNFYDRINRLYESHIMRIHRCDEGTGPSDAPHADHSEPGARRRPDPTE